MSGWRNDAACRDMGPALFFSDYQSDHARAKAVCESCPVRAECLADALDTPQFDDYGIRGGLSVSGRHGIRGRKKPPIRHGTPGGYRAHLRRDEPMCDACRTAARIDREDRRIRQAAAVALAEWAERCSA